MPQYTTPNVYTEEVTSQEGPVVSAATGFGGMQAITEKGPVGVPTRTRTFAAWKEIFGTYEVATRGDAAYEAEHFFKEGGVELITSRQANYTNLDDKIGRATCRERV